MNLKKESELKVVLESFADYLKLVGSLAPIDSEIIQKNAFFDTSDRVLGNDGWVLRVRTETYSFTGDSRGLVTLKGLDTGAAEFTERTEIEQSIEHDLAEQLIVGAADLFDYALEPVDYLSRRYGRLTLSRLFKFTNIRKTKQQSIGRLQYLLEVDKSEFADGAVDYELEIEVNDSADQPLVAVQIKKLLQSLGLHFQIQKASKFERALTRAGLIR